MSSPLSNPLTWKCQDCGKGGRPDEFGRKNGKMIHVRCRDNISGPLAHEKAFKAGGEAFVKTLLETGSVEGALAAAATEGVRAGSAALIKEKLTKTQIQQCEKAGFILDHL